MHGTMSVKFILTKIISAVNVPKQINFFGWHNFNTSISTHVMFLYLYMAGDALPDDSPNLKENK